MAYLVVGGSTGVANLGGGGSTGVLGGGVQHRSAIARGRGSTGVAYLGGGGSTGVP